MQYNTYKKLIPLYRVPNENKKIIFIIVKIAIRPHYNTLSPISARNSNQTASDNLQYQLTE